MSSNWAGLISGQALLAVAAGGRQRPTLEAAPLRSTSLASKHKQTCFRQTSPLMNDLHKDASDWKRRESQRWRSGDQQTRVSSSEEQNGVNRVVLVVTHNNGGRACACLDSFLFPISPNVFKKDKWVMEELIKWHHRSRLWWRHNKYNTKLDHQASSWPI